MVIYSSHLNLLISYFEVSYAGVQKCLLHVFNKYLNICESIVDNGTREGLDKFLKAASKEPETVLHYEFMQDYKVTTDTNRYLIIFLLFQH